MRMPISSFFLCPRDSVASVIISRDDLASRRISKRAQELYSYNISICCDRCGYISIYKYFFSKHDIEAKSIYAFHRYEENNGETTILHVMRKQLFHVYKSPVSDNCVDGAARSTHWRYIIRRARGLQPRW